MFQVWSNPLEHLLLSWGPNLGRQWLSSKNFKVSPEIRYYWLLEDVVKLSSSRRNSRCMHYFRWINFINNTLASRVHEAACSVSFASHKSPAATIVLGCRDPGNGRGICRCMIFVQKISSVCSSSPFHLQNFTLL